MLFNIKTTISVVLNNVIYLSLRLLLCFVCKLLLQIIIVVKIDKIKFYCYFENDFWIWLDRKLLIGLSGEF